VGARARCGITIGPENGRAMAWRRINEVARTSRCCSSYEEEKNEIRNSRYPALVVLCVARKRCRPFKFPSGKQPHPRALISSCSGLIPIMGVSRESPKPWPARMAAGRLASWTRGSRRSGSAARNRLRSACEKSPRCVGGGGCVRGTVDSSTELLSPKWCHKVHV
jgi:hypothetical protein